MIDFNKELVFVQKANDAVRKIKSEDDICKIDEIINGLDIDTLKRVLKKYVHKI